MGQGLDDETLDARLRRAPDLSGEALDDGVLRAYLAGALDDVATAQVEVALVENPTARAQLRALSGAAEALTEADFAAAEAAVGAPRLRWAPWAAAGLALAAAVIFWVARPGAPATEWRLDGPRGGVQATRAEAAPASDVFLPHSVLTVDLVPTGEPGGAQVSATVDDAPVAVKIERSAGGALRISAPAQALFGARYGRRTLVLTLTEGDAPPRPFSLTVDYRPTLEEEEPQ